MREDNWKQKSGTIGVRHTNGGFWRKKSGTILVREPTPA